MVEDENEMIGYCCASCETTRRVHNLTSVNVEIVCTFPLLPLELQSFSRLSEQVSLIQDEDIRKKCAVKYTEILLS
jgi:hypothetical protein